MSFESIRQNPEIPKTLEQLTPTKGSLPWLKQQGRKEEADLLRQKATNAIQKLTRFKDINFTPKEAKECFELAAKTGSELLIQWTEFNIYYPNLQLPNSLMLINNAKLELARNLAVITRDEAMEFKQQGRKEEETLQQAKNLFSWYVKRLRYHKPVSIPLVDIQEKLNTDIVEMFFSDDVKNADNELIQTGINIFDDNQVTIEGIDNGLIRVYVACAANLPKDHFPQVYNEYNKLKQYIANKHSVSVEDMDKFSDWETNEIFPNQDTQE